MAAEVADLTVEDLLSVGAPATDVETLDVVDAVKGHVGRQRGEVGRVRLDRDDLTAASQEPGGEDRVLSYMGPHIDEYGILIRRATQPTLDSSDQFGLVIRIDDVKVGGPRATRETTDGCLDRDVTEPELGEHADADASSPAKHLGTREETVVRRDQRSIARPPSPSHRLDGPADPGEAHSDAGDLGGGRTDRLRIGLHERSGPREADGLRSNQTGDHRRVLTPFNGTSS